MSEEARFSRRTVLIALWAIAGVTAVLLSAIFRLAPLALVPLLHHDLSPAQLFVYVGWCLLNAYAEGYRGFQRSYVPRTLARAFYLGAHPRPLFVLFAPFFAMGLFFATRRRLLIAWCLPFGIYGLVRLVRLLPQPERGILDAGVVVGLGYGCGALLYGFVAILYGAKVTASPQVPVEVPEKAR